MLNKLLTALRVLAVVSLNFSSSGKGPFLTGKAKKIINLHQKAHSPGGGGFAFLKALIFEHPVDQLTKKYFKHLKTKNFTNEGCLCC